MVRLQCMGGLPFSRERADGTPVAAATFYEVASDGPIGLNSGVADENDGGLIVHGAR